MLIVAVVYTASLDGQLKKKRRQNAAHRNQVKNLREAIVSPGATNASPGIRPVQRAVTANGGVYDQLDYWSTDPFNRSFATEPVAGGQGTGGIVDNDRLPTLHGVMFTNGRPAAMIDGKMYVEGDRSDNLIVVSITARAVILEDVVSGTRFTLEVE